MKYFTIFCLTLALTLTFVNGFSDKLTIVTIDGSVINVPMPPQYTNINIRVRTDYGELNFNITSIQRITMVTNNVHSIQTFKGEMVKGTITSPNIVVPTKYGNLTIPPTEIGKMIVIITNVNFTR
ncbi:MAG: hypothetical protein N2712_03735 [Brevinematales bacterium]|nr:hypothetical protein [Brevinematales bacterium]